MDPRGLVAPQSHNGRGESCDTAVSKVRAHVRAVQEGIRENRLRDFAIADRVPSAIMDAAPTGRNDVNWNSGESESRSNTACVQLEKTNAETITPLQRMTCNGANNTPSNFKVRGLLLSPKNHIQVLYLQPRKNFYFVQCFYLWSC